MPDTERIPVAYRAVVLAGVLLVLGLLFRQLATALFVAVGRARTPHLEGLFRRGGPENRH